MYDFNIIIITMGVSPIVKPLLQSRHHVVGIIECAPRNRSDSKKRGWAYQTARYVYSRIKRNPFSLAVLSKNANIPYFYMADGSSPELEEWVKSLNPDLIVVFSMTQLLKKNIFIVPRYGTVNLHPALLPKYRGPNPWFWMCYDYDLQPGVTVHYIDEGEDTGDIIYQEQFEISPGTQFQDFFRRAIEEIGVKLLLKAIDDIAEGNAPRHPQAKESPTVRARNVRPDEGSRLVDWEAWPVQRVWHFLRGAAHWTDILPPLTGIYKGHSWEIGNYEICSMSKNYIPGKIYSDNRSTFLACRDGRIILQKSFSLKRFILQRLSN